MTPEDFRVVFTASESWGTLAQHRHDGTQTDWVSVKWGQLRLRTLALQVAEGQQVKQVRLGDSPTGLEFDQHGQEISIAFPEEVRLHAGDQLRIEITS
jgi:hypothetical protein